MNNNEHTPGPWRYNDDSDAGGLVIWAENGDRIARVCWYGKQSGTPWATEANARRIVACVNACAGITTHELTIMTGRTSIANQIKACDAIYSDKESKSERRSRFAKQRDALLSICEELAESSGYWSEYDVPLGIVDRLNAAIASAKGELPQQPIEQDDSGSRAEFGAPQ